MMDKAEAENADVRELAEDIADWECGEVVGVSEDGNRFGIKATSIGKSGCRIAMQNGFAVEESRQAGLSDDRQHYTFARITEF